MKNEGDFSFIDDELSRDALSKTYQAISNTKNWENLKNFIVDESRGFMFSQSDFLSEIGNETERLGVGHSGSSWGWSMRNMDFISKHGWETYIKKWDK
jgi:hypothetical protein